MSTIIQNHIDSTPSVRGGKPRISGTRITVSDVVIWHERCGCSPEEIVADHPHLTLSDVHAALAYYFDHREEIRAEIEESQKFAEELRQRTPSKLAEKLHRRNGGQE